MKNAFRVVLLFSLALSSYQCLAQEISSKERYSYKKGEADGTGKWYMGREIAHVMGFQGMGWLERPEREKEENTSRLLHNMNIQSIEEKPQNPKSNTTSSPASPPPKT